MLVKAATSQLAASSGATFEDLEEKSMKKLILKLFMPSAETMAKMAAKAAADFVNGCDK